ncbi:hypothetical protein [Crossiella sp. NPDC003009]
MELWQRSRARWLDPFVLDCLSRIRTRRDWAAAVRQIDRRFGSPEVVARIEARPVTCAHPGPSQQAGQIGTEWALR